MIHFLIAVRVLTCELLQTGQLLKLRSIPSEDDMPSNDLPHPGKQTGKLNSRLTSSGIHGEA
jgi:hypothetical protein